MTEVRTAKGDATSETVTWQGLTEGLEINQAAWSPQAERILVPEVTALMVRLHRELQPARLELLAARVERQKSWDAGGVSGFLEGEIAEIAQGEWQIAPLAEDLLQRRVEITGPINDTKMVINMLSRTATGDRADAAMLDFEDSMKPAWANVLQGVENLMGAADGSLSFVKPAQGGEPEKLYQLDPEDMPLLMVRCRGLHLEESNLRVDGEPLAGGIMDLTLSVFHTAKVLRSQGKTPKSNVPKVEH